MYSVHLKALRKALGLNQTEFGEKLGVTRSVVKNWEVDAVIPNEMAIRHICNTFRVNEHWFRTGEGEMFEETLADLIDRLIKKKNMGPGGALLMNAILHVYEELGEEKCIEIIYDLLPEVKDDLETLDINRAIERENASARSSQESAQ